MGIRKDIDSWKRLTDKITTTWVKEYFELTSNDDSSVDWVANDIGGVFSFADYWVSFENVLECYKLDVKKEEFFDWYYFCLDNHSVNISLAKFILSPKERKEQEEKHLAELRERVKTAEKELEKAIKQYEDK